MSPADARVDLLVLEPVDRGHGREWLRHLACYARRCGSAPSLAFAVAPRVAEALRRDLSPGSPLGPVIIALSAREVALCTHRNLAFSGMARWWVMRRYLRRTGARNGLFLEFDHLALPLALRIPLGAGRSVSGILFRPSVHYAHDDDRFRPGERLRELRKDVFYRLALRSPALHRVYTLDDAFPAFARTRYRGGAKVAALPDPAHPRVRPTAAERALVGQAPHGRTLLVLFGVLSRRKGILALLRALAALDEVTARRIAVIVAGEVEPSVKLEVDDALNALAATRLPIWFRFEPRYMSAGELDALIERADVVLAPYQRYVGSSGILMWAASRGRPVITQDYGLIGRLVREHGLGLAVDTTDPAELARAIALAADRGAGALAEPARLAAFAAGRTPDAFAAEILGPPARADAPGRATAGLASPGRPADRPGR